MFIKIYKELVLIRKELQAIRSSMESNSNITFDGKAISQAVRKSTVQEMTKENTSQEVE